MRRCGSYQGAESALLRVHFSGPLRTGAGRRRRVAGVLSHARSGIAIPPTYSIVYLPVTLTLSSRSLSPMIFASTAGRTLMLLIGPLCRFVASACAISRRGGNERQNQNHDGDYSRIGRTNTASADRISSVTDRWVSPEHRSCSGPHRRRAAAIMLAR